jgi:hypothetical protein
MQDIQLVARHFWTSSSKTYGYTELSRRQQTGALCLEISTETQQCERKTKKYDIMEVASMD